MTWTNDDTRDMRGAVSERDDEPATDATVRDLLAGIADEPDVDEDGHAGAWCRTYDRAALAASADAVAWASLRGRLDWVVCHVADVARGAAEDLADALAGTY